MADDKKNTGKQDDLRVDVNDANEVEYVHSKFPGYSHEEIAERLSISPHTVHKYLTRALFQCRMVLEREVQ